jgi:hypothetical protein
LTAVNRFNCRIRWGARIVALAVVAVGVAGHAHAAPGEDPRLALVRLLDLVEAERAALNRTALPIYSRGGKFAGLKDCIASKATADRLEATLVAVIGRSVAADDAAQPVLRFLSSPPGKKFLVGVERRNRGSAAELTGPNLPGRRPMKFAGVVLFSNELTEQEARTIDSFLRSDEGKPLRSILSDTAGFAQLTRSIAQMNAFAAECGIDLK